MSELSVPWRSRRRGPTGPVGRTVATLAVGVYRLAGPIVSRIPGPILLAALAGGVLAAWAVYGLFAYADAVFAQMPADAGPPGAYEYAGLREHLASSFASSITAGVLWVLQFALVRDVIAMAGVVGLVTLVPVFAIWWERKVAGHIQSRCGPMRVGGWHGWAQSMADGLKLLCKEDLAPRDADKSLFLLAPYLAFVPVIVAFVALPFGTYWAFRTLDVGLLFILAMLGVEVVGVIIAGWASNSKWSLYGAMREACQMVSYEIPMGLALLIPVMCAGSLSLVTIGHMQNGGWHTWLAFRSPITLFACLAYFIASLASCKRAPFDLPESESELVAGFHTEYSGWRWCLFFFAEYAGMFVVCALAVVLFLGAWNSPLPSSWAIERDALWASAINGVLFSGPLWFLGKTLSLLFVQIWLRWTLPRIRIDQVLHACVQFMLPLVMLLLLGNTLWELWVRPDTLLFVVANLATSIAGAIVVAGFLAVVLYGWRNRRVLVEPRGWKYAVDLRRGS